MREIDEDEVMVIGEKEKLGLLRSETDGRKNLWR